MHGGEKTCPELQGCLEEKRYWKENGNVKANVGPARIMMAPWLTSTRPGHANKTVREHHPDVFMYIRPEQRLQWLLFSSSRNFCVVFQRGCLHHVIVFVRNNHDTKLGKTENPWDKIWFRGKQ